MAHQPPDRPDTGGVTIPRRTVLGTILAAGVIAPVLGSGTARADTGTDDPPDGPPAGEDYDPDDIGSAPWW